MIETLFVLLVATAVSGVVPLVNAELLVVGAAASLPAIGLPLVAAVSTIGQMSTKATLFGFARWAPERLPVRARASIERARRTLEGRTRSTGSLVFTSAATGLPPFYGVSLASGALGMRLPDYLIVGGAGRFVRFAVIAWLGRRFGAGALGALAQSPLVAAAAGG